jgi:hypothetical protein
MATPGKVSGEGPIFSNMEFPAYRFQEYPKWITLGDGRRVIVESAKEELTEISKEPPQASNPLVDERNALAAKVAERDQELADLKAKLAKLEVTPTDKTADKTDDKTPAPPAKVK